MHEKRQRAQRQTVNAMPVTQSRCEIASSATAHAAMRAIADVLSGATPGSGGATTLAIIGREP
jgi:hypothetical protein